MNRRRAARPVFEAGFTILELLIVMTILALATSIAVPTFRRPPDGVRLRAVTNELAAALRATRSAAMAKNIDTMLLINLDRKQFESSASPKKKFASDIEATITYASPMRIENAEAGFRFFPDGSSTGGAVTFAIRGIQARVCVDWLTGQVRQESNC